MSWMGKTEEDFNGLKLGFLKTVQPNSFSKLIPAACNFKNNAQETFVCLGSLILSFTCNFFAYFKFHSDWGRVIGKIKQNERDCRDTAPLTRPLKKRNAQYMCRTHRSLSHWSGEKSKGTDLISWPNNLTGKRKERWLNDCKSIELRLTHEVWIIKLIRHRSEISLFISCDKQCTWGEIQSD